MEIIGKSNLKLNKNLMSTFRPTAIPSVRLRKAIWMKFRYVFIISKSLFFLIFQVALRRVVKSGDTHLESLENILSTP